MKIKRIGNFEHVLRDYNYHDKRYGCKYGRAMRSKSHSKRKVRRRPRV